jgi:hypothetical protein
MLQASDPILRPAERDMAHQRSMCDGYAYSLDSMWRASGSPDGKDPQSWLLIAGLLVDGVADYFHRLDELRELPVEVRSKGTRAEVVFVCENTEHGVPLTGPDDPWQIGDTLVPYLLAYPYAMFLDADS